MQRDETGILIYDRDTSGLITFGLFGGNPPDTANKFRAGCILMGNGKVYTNAGTSAVPSFQDINDVSTGEIADSAVTTAKIADANVTPVKTNIVQAVTATDAGLTTGTILDTTTHATVTSSGATKQVILPTPTPGMRIVIDVGATGFDLKSSAPATVGINGGTGASAKSAIAANSTCFLTCVSATSWKGFFMDADGDVAKVPAAA